MAQEQVWDREYRKSQFLTKENKPQSDVVRFAKWLKKEQKFEISNTQVLDLGSGVGRNSFYFAEFGAKVTGLEISKTAIEIAEKNKKGITYSGILKNTRISKLLYVKQSIGEKFPNENETVDLVLDVTSSNSLTESERELYLSETNRVLKSGGYFFMKALCKDGDDNAKFLLKSSPGKEKDTYIIKELGLTERVWTKADFTATYEKYFKILKLEKKTSYSRMNDRSYKRNFWIAYMQK